MPNPLEITSDDIAQLGDADLRTLIGRLCEEDYRRAGLPTKGITWGGHQDAPDGGLDVVVRDEVNPPQDSPIPRAVTGFQVKKPILPVSKITSEMRYQGDLRQCLKDLISENGSYIVVSSGTNATDSALQNRLDAMREAVSTEDDHENLYLDFFDRGRVATWVRSHPSLIQWVLEKVGRKAKGWYPYYNWANPKAGIEEEYLLDDGLRLHDRQRRPDDEFSIKEGIQHLRATLSSPRYSVRLAGLSGVGKTRLAQALFDGRIGEQALDPDFAFYTDVAFDPDPDPRSFAEQLIAARTRAVLIVDNCKPELHRQLTRVCAVPESTVSLLTIEYDVREDLPEETSVFRLEPASDTLIQKLVENRFPHISQVDAGTIAESSGGNARIAIALANTVDKGESLSGLSDVNLFERLFEQRHGSDKNLLMSARACSLVYSFEGTDTESDESELSFLASLIGISGEELYRDVATIKDRDLIQSRDIWRAVLPQAIANRLAKQALESIPPKKLSSTFIRGPERLIKSFSRRLGYLHQCKEAIEIVEEWLSPEGWLGRANCNFNELGIQTFRNIAPVSPKKSLEMIERASNGDDGNKFTSRENKHHDIFVRLLRHIAYEPDLFERSVELICRFAISERPDETNNSARDVLKSLFYHYLSGTHATVESRASVIDQLLDSEDNAEQKLGMDLLEATLETTHFTSHHEFRFGARSRNFGYQPKTNEEYKKWYETFVNLCVKMSISEKPLAEKARQVLADNIRELWNRTKMFDVLMSSALQIHRVRPWERGWIAVKEMIHYDSKHFSEEESEKIQEFEKMLRPENLYDLVSSYVFSDKHISFDLEDSSEDDGDIAKGWEKANESARMLGIRVSQDNDAFERLLPEMITTTSHRIGFFGEGLAEGCTGRPALWEKMCAAFKSTQPEIRNASVMLGFLSACANIDSDLYSAILDSLIEDETLGEYFPVFQMTSTLDQKGIERLNKALDSGKAKIEYFRHLAWGRAHEALSDDDLAILLEKIISKEDGVSTAIEILTMRFHGKKDSPEYSERLIAATRDVLCSCQFSRDRRRNDLKDYELSQVVGIGLDGKDGVSAANELCQHLAQAIIDGKVYIMDYPSLLNSIAHIQPFVFLDTFIGNDNAYLKARMYYEDFERRENPLNNISDADIISWCEKDPANRYTLIASSMHLFKKSDEEFAWKPILSELLARTPALEGLFREIGRSMRPSSRGGSRADIMQRRAELYKELFEHERAEISDLAKAGYAELRKDIDETRKSEEKRFRTQFDSFE